MRFRLPEPPHPIACTTSVPSTPLTGAQMSQKGGSIRRIVKSRQGKCHLLFGGRKPRKQCMAALMGGFEFVGETCRKGEQQLPPKQPHRPAPQEKTHISWGT